MNLTAEQQKWLVEHFHHAKNRELAAALGISLRSVTRYASTLAISKQKIVLTEKQQKWLVKHFQHTKNAEIAATLGVSVSTVSRFARELHLHKTKQFMNKCQREMAEKARKANLLRVLPDDFRIPNSELYQFKPGVSPAQRLGKKRNAKRIAAARDTRNATIRKERARIVFGLPQKTNLRLVRQPREKVLLRWYLKRQGYHIDDAARVAYYDENTHRGKRVEKREQPWYRFEPAANDQEIKQMITV